MGYMSKTKKDEFQANLDEKLKELDKNAESKIQAAQYAEIENLDNIRKNDNSAFDNQQVMVDRDE